jgi:hypothetical protein
MYLSNQKELQTTFTLQERAFAYASALIKSPVSEAPNAYWKGANIASAASVRQSLLALILSEDLTKSVMMPHPYGVERERDNHRFIRCISLLEKVKIVVCPLFLSFVNSTFASPSTFLPDHS